MDNRKQILGVSCDGLNKIRTEICIAQFYCPQNTIESSRKIYFENFTHEQGEHCTVKLSSVMSQNKMFFYAFFVVDCHMGFFLCVGDV